MTIVVHPRNTLLAAACVVLQVTARAEGEAGYRIGDVHGEFTVVQPPGRGEASRPGGSARGSGEGIIFSDDFESGMGSWVVTDDAGAGVQWADADCWSTSGTRSAACAAGGAQARACGEDYLGGMKTWMVHGPFSLADSVICASELRFALKLDAEPGLDGLFVGTSTDGEVFSGAQFTGVVEGLHAMDLTSLLGSPQVWIGFRFHSDASVARPDGAQVDDVVVTRTPPVPGPLTYGFTLSASSTDPRVHKVSAAGYYNIYLWYYCSQAGSDGLTYVEITLNAQAGGVFSVTPLNGFINAGSSPTLLLANPQCPSPPLPIAAILVIPYGPVSVCFDPCKAFLIEGCQAPPLTRSADFIGAAVDGVVPCQSATMCGNPTTVETASWGSIKALYR
jgi:hypothetical protein